MRLKIKGLLIGFLVSSLEGLSPLLFILMFSPSSLKGESNAGVILVVYILPLIIIPIGCVVGFLIGSKVNKKVKRNQAIKLEQEKRSTLNTHLTNTLLQQYNCAQNISQISEGNYIEAWNILDEAKPFSFYKELMDLYQSAINKHYSAYARCLKVGGEPNVRLAVNHFLHINNMEKKNMAEAKKIAANVLSFFSKSSHLFNQDMYGKINQQLYSDFQNLDVNQVMINRLNSSLNDIAENQNLSILNENFLNTLLLALGSVSVSFPFDADKFSRVFDLFDKYTFFAYDNGYNSIKIPSFDGMFLQIFSYYKMGKGVLERFSKNIDNWINANIWAGYHNNITLMASAMMWLGNYELELQLLRIAASNNINMTPSIQKRLQALEKGETSTPEAIEVEQNGKFQYDYSSVTWKDKDFELFYKNLLQKNKNINYALAFKEFKKMFKSKGNSVLKFEQIVNSLNRMAKEEYLSEITCSAVNVDCLSETAELDEKAILVIPSQTETKADYVGELVFYDRIGINVSIRIISVFIPDKNVDIQTNMNRIISLKQGSQPKLNLILDSIRDSIAREIDKMCENTTANSIY